MVPTRSIPDQGAVTVGNTSTTVLDGNAGRQQLWLCNTSDESISIGIGQAAVLNSGIVIPAGTAIVIDTFTSSLPIYAICASGSKNIAYCEVTK